MQIRKSGLWITGILLILTAIWMIAYLIVNRILYGNFGLSDVPLFQLYPEYQDFGALVLVVFVGLVAWLGKDVVEEAKRLAR